MPIRPPKSGVPRTRVFKCRLSEQEHRVLEERARGYPSPAEYARRCLLAGWTLPMHRLAVVTEAFRPVQQALDLAAAEGHGEAAARGVEALRRILAAVTAA